MTLESFLEALKNGCKEKKAIRVKNVLGGVRLRVKGQNDFCPITFVCFHKTGKFFNQSDWREAAKKIRIAPKIALDIVSASDWPLDKEDTSARQSLTKQLFSACKTPRKNKKMTE